MPQRVRGRLRSNRIAAEIGLKADPEHRGAEGREAGGDQGEPIAVAIHEGGAEANSVPSSPEHLAHLSALGAVLPSRALAVDVGTGDGLNLDVLAPLYSRVIAVDRAKPIGLWSFNSRSQRGWVWNDDWDAAPLQIGDYLLEGGENSWFYVIRLNRRYDDQHRVQVSPQIVMRVPG